MSNVTQLQFVQNAKEFGMSKFECAKQLAEHFGITLEVAASIVLRNWGN